MMRIINRYFKILKIKTSCKGDISDLSSRHSEEEPPGGEDANGSAVHRGLSLFFMRDDDRVLHVQFRHGLREAAELALSGIVGFHLPGHLDQPHRFATLPSEEIRLQAVGGPVVEHLPPPATQFQKDGIFHIRPTFSEKLPYFA